MTKPEQTSQSQQLKAGTQLTLMLKLGVFGLLFVLACLQHFALTLPQALTRQTGWLSPQEVRPVFRKACVCCIMEQRIGC